MEMFTAFLFILTSLMLGVTTQSCSMAGRYPIAGSECKSYMHCTIVGTTLIQTNFTCPSTSIFNGRLQQCVSNSTYTCVDSVCQQRGPLQPFTVYYGDPNDTTNTRYFTCVNQNGVWVPSYGVCKTNQCFVYDQAVTYREGCCTSNLTTCGPAIAFTCVP